MAYSFTVENCEAVVQQHSKDQNFFTLTEKSYKGFRNDTLAVITVWRGQELVFKSIPLETSGGTAQEFYAAAEVLTRQGLANKGIEGDKVLELDRRIYFFWPESAKRYRESNKEI